MLEGPRRSPSMPFPEVLAAAMAVSLLLLSIAFYMGRQYEKWRSKCREKDEDEQMHDMGLAKRLEEAEFLIAPKGTVLHLSEECSYLSRTPTLRRIRLCHRCVKNSEQH